VNTFRRFVREAVLQPTQSSSAQAGGIVTQQPGATRNLPLASGLVSAIQRGLAGTGLNWHSYSGGQPAKGSGGRRVGSTRHDNGRASDGYFKDAATGRALDANNAADRQRIAGALGKLRQSGIQGIGWGPGYMGSKNFHLDIVSPEIWGDGGRSANAHQWVIAAAGGSVAAPAGGTTPGGETDTDAAQDGSSLPPSGDDNSGKQEFLDPQAAVQAATNAISQLARYGKSA
jgi:hypothetical protein